MRFAIAFLAVSLSFAAGPVKVLVVTGGHDHPPSFYSIFDHPRITANVDPHSNAFQNDFIKRYDVLVLYDDVQDLPPDKRADLQAFVEAGKGIVVLHHAICSYTEWPWWYRDAAGGRYRFAADAQGPPSTFKHDETIPVTVVKRT